jgi:hypothetical protein
MSDARIAPETLWTIRELAAYLCYKPPTVATLLSRDPGRLPPRVAALGHPRWHPATVRAWAAQQSAPIPAARRAGRPRKAV